MSKPKMWDEFAAWADHEASDPTSPLHGTIESLRHASKAHDGHAFIEALKKFGAVCYIQGLVDAGWRPPPNATWNEDAVKQAIERITAEVISRANQN